MSFVIYYEFIIVTNNKKWFDERFNNLFWYVDVATRGTEP